MEKKRTDLNGVVGDDHPVLSVELNSLTKQLCREEPNGKNIWLYGRCGTVSINGPKKFAKGFAEYVHIETDSIFDEARDYARLEDSTDMILEYLRKIRLLAEDLGVSPGYLKLLQILEKSTKGVRKIRAE